MSAADPLPASFVSDAPLRSSIQPDAHGRQVLRRELDEPWRRDSVALALFRSEIAAAVRISAAAPPFLVPLIAADERHIPWLTREFFPAGTIEQRLRGGPPLEMGEILTASAGVLEGLEALRQLDLVHGDPSPRNIVLTSDGGVRLVDPVSSRRRFAEADLPPSEEQERERWRFFSWFRNSLMDCVSRDGDSEGVAYRILTELDAPRAPTETAERIRSLLAESQRFHCPILAPAAREPSDGESPAAIPVSLVVGRILESRALFRAAKLISAEGAGSGADLRNTLSRKSITVPSHFPAPARSLAASLAGDGVEVAITPEPVSRPSPEPWRTAEPGDQQPDGPLFEGVPKASRVPIFGLPANLRRLRALAAILFSEEDSPNPFVLAKETAAAAALVLANAIGAQILLLLAVTTVSSLVTAIGQ